MIDSSKVHYLARKRLIDNALRAIRACKEFEWMETTAYYELAKYGINVRAEKEGLFDAQLWARKENVPKILELIEAFLWRQIK